jgi:hypothetical protein
MSGTIITRNDDANAERWRQWQLGYEASSRTGARRARTVITLILTVLGVWLCLQLLSLQLWARTERRGARRSHASAVTVGNRSQGWKAALFRRRARS